MRCTPTTLAFARRLRSSLTPAEQRLWRRLRNGRMLGVRFRRRHPIAGFIIDFYCIELHLAIEVDGGQHADSRTDAQRDARLGRHGVQVLRYWNDDVLLRIDEVLIDIAQHCSTRIACARGGTAPATM